MSPTFRGGPRKAPKYWAVKGTHKKQSYRAHSMQVHVYGGVCRYGKSKLLFVTGTSGQDSNYAQVRGKYKGAPCDGVCGAEYTKEVLPGLYGDAKTIFRTPGVDRWAFMQDNAPVHSGGIPWLDRKRQMVIDDWPPKSPDMNRIEHVWAEMHKVIRKQYTKNPSLGLTFAQFKERVKSAWKRVCSISYLRRLTHDPITRLAEVRGMKGGMTGH